MSRQSSEAEVELVPRCIEWSKEEVAEWIGSLGYEEYKASKLKVSLALIQASR